MISSQKLEEKGFEVDTLKRDLEHRIIKIRNLEDQLYQKELATQETLLKQDLQGKILQLNQKLEASHSKIEQLSSFVMESTNKYNQLEQTFARKTVAEDPLLQRRVQELEAELLEKKPISGERVFVYLDFILLGGIIYLLQTISFCLFVILIIIK